MSEKTSDTSRPLPGPHEDVFLHDDSCRVCRAHRYHVDEVRRGMLDELAQALEQAGIARPWSPAEEWARLLKLVAHGSPER